MSSRTRSFAFVVVWAVVAAAGAAQIPTSPHPSTGDEVARNEYGNWIQDMEAWLVPEFSILWDGSRRLIVEARHCSRGSAPVLHLVKEKSGRQIAMAQGFQRGVVRLELGAAGTTATIASTVYGRGPSPPGGSPPPPPSRSDEKYVLVVRAGSRFGSGSCALYRDGQLVVARADFRSGGKARFPLSRSDVLTSVRLPGGAGAGHRIYVLENDGVGIERRHEGGGGLGGAVYAVPWTMGHRDILVAGPQRVGYELDPVGGGALRLIRNDVQHGDRDGDGLGTGLEWAIGGCESTSEIARGFDCSLAADPLDTDGDGLRDDWELLGRRDVWPPLPLPTWGADMRHKDVFVEVDFMMTMKKEPVRRIQPEQARAFARLFEDTIRTLTKSQRARRARSLRNPDGLPGIRVHLDTGVAPADDAPSSDHALYGNWGGHDTIPPVCRDGSCKGRSAREASQEHLAPERRGVFYYAAGFNGATSSCSHHRISCAWPLRDMRVAAHEFAHTLGLGHSGPANYSVVDPNCKPNYPSLINYAFQNERGIGFFDGVGRGRLDNSKLRERSAVSPYDDPTYLDHLERLFEYNVDRENGHVDWNRDGEFSLLPVVAYANFRPGTSCEWTRYGAIPVPGAKSEQAPALVRLSGRTYLLYTTRSGRLSYAWSDAPFDCPEAGRGCNGATFITASLVAPGTEEFPTNVVGFDAIRARHEGKERILVVTTDVMGALTQYWLEPSFRFGVAGLSVAAPPERVRTGRAASGAPSLAVAPGGRVVHLSFKDTTNRVRMTTRIFESWDPSREVVVADPETGETAPLELMSDEALPAIEWVSLPRDVGSPSRAFDEGLYGAFAGKDGTLKFYGYDNGRDLWREIAVREDDTKPVLGRPAMAYVPADPGIGRPDRFYLLYTVVESQDLRWQMSYVDGVGAVQHRIGLDSRFDNGSSDAHGVDLIFEPGVDSNLRAAVTGKNDSIQFRPNADGLAIFPLVGWDDWEIMGVDLCRVLTKENQGPDEAPRCHPWRW